MKDSNNSTYGKYSNPNIAYSHYWIDANNVYQDLSSFKKLYVKFHNCAWSVSSLSSDNNANSCGSTHANSEDQWWVGMNPCMGANVAYSLYGILSSDLSYFQNNHCSSKTFINSFFTTDGLTSFTEAASTSTLNYVSNLNQVCSINENGYGIGTGCSSDGTFTLSKFNGACSSGNYISTTNTLDSLNKALTEEMECQLIYSSDGSSADYATNLLSHSVACQLNVGTSQQSSKACPDPFGIVRKYEINFILAQQAQASMISPTERREHVKFVAFVTLMSVGVALILLRLCQLRRLLQQNRRFHEQKYMEEEDSTITADADSIAYAVAYAVYS